MVVFRVQNLCNNFSHGILFHSTQIISAVEHFHVKFGRTCRPNSEPAYSFSVLTRNINVVRDSHNFCVVLMIYDMVLIIPVIVYITVKMNFYALLRHRLHPNFAARKPKVRKFRLPAFY